MENLRADQVEDLLQDLLFGDMVLTRNGAAERLGELTWSSSRIAGALVAAQDLDERWNVREAAEEALQAQVHQAAIARNRDAVMAEVETCKIQVREWQAHERAAAQAAQELAERKSRLWGAGIGSLLLVIVALLFLVEKVGGPSWVGMLAFFALTVIIVYLFVKKRCPTCNRYVGDIWSADYCPSCGTKLR